MTKNQWNILGVDRHIHSKTSEKMHIKCYSFLSFIGINTSTNPTNITIIHNSHLC